MNLVHYLNVVIYALLVVIGIIGWRAGRNRRAALTFAAAFLILLVSSMLGLAIEEPYSENELRLTRIRISIAAFLPPMLLLLQHYFGGWTRRTVIIAFAVTASTALLTLFGPVTPIDSVDQGAAGITWLIVFGGSWIIIAGAACIGFVKLGIGRPGVVRRRMWTLAGGVGSLVVLTLFVFGSDTDVDGLVSSSVVLASGVMFWLGFRPPGWIRELWRRDERDELRSSFTRFLEAASEQDALAAVLPPFMDVLGARGVIILGASGEVLLEHGLGAGCAADVVAIARSLDGQQASFADGDVIVSRNGALTTIVVLATTTPLFGDEELSTVTAVSAFAELAIERGRNMDTLRERDAQLRAAQEIAAMGSWEWEIDADRLQLSPALAEIFGLPDTACSMTYEDMLELIHPDDRQQVGALIEQALRSGEPYLHDHRMVRPDGSQFYVHARGQVTRDGGRRSRRMTGIVQDITERKLGEEHLRAMFEREREVTSRLQTIDTVKNNILAAVSHELRTPLTSVLGFALTLRDRDQQLTSESRVEIIRHLADEALRLQQLLGDLLDIDRLQRGIVEPELASTNLHDLVARIVASVPDGEHVIQDVEDLTLQLDAGKFDRVVANLLQNAQRHTPPGTVVSISAARRGDVIRLEVHDDGQGVPVEFRERIFLPFDRGGAGLDHAPGTGVGLAIVRQFVELHGGRTWVEDAPGGGAKFVVELPAVASEARE